MFVMKDLIVRALPTTYLRLKSTLQYFSIQLGYFSRLLNLPFLLGVTIMIHLWCQDHQSDLAHHPPWASYSVYAIGAGLLMTLKVDSGLSKCFGYQAMYGFRAGAGLQQPVVAVQTFSNLIRTP
jgi:hypothetical protein